jgi:hypothetical protein
MKIGNRFRPVLLILVAAALMLITSCAQTPGGVFLTINSSGLDGQTGYIRMELHEGTAGGTVTYWHEEADYTLNSASAYLWNFASVTPGTYVVVAYLDTAPTNSVPSTGDAISSAPNPTVTVTPDDTIPVTIILDAFKP